MRTPIDRIELTPNDRGKLEIDFPGDLAGILSLVAKKDRPLGESDPVVEECTKLVAGACNTLCLLLFVQSRIGRK